MDKIYFSVLSYNPSFISNESINVGVLFRYNDRYYFHYIKKFTRLASFDDELNIDFIKAYLKSIKEEVEYNVFNINKNIDFDNYIDYFVNELKFSDIQSLNCQDYEQAIEETKKIYLRYEYDPSKRPTQNDQIKYYANLLKSNNINYTKKQIPGGYEGIPVNYDFLIGNIGLKFFTFKNKEVRKMVQSAKSWAFTAEKMKINKSIDTTFIYDTEILNDNSFNSIKEILSKNAKTLSIEESTEYIFHLKEKMVCS